MSQRERAEQLIRRFGIMRRTDLENKGVHPQTLARLVAEGVLYQPSRGLYELANAEIDLSHSLAEISARCSKGVICLVTALQFHNITLQSPGKIWVAIGQSDRQPKIDNPATTFVRFSNLALSLGVEIHEIDSVPVRIFDPAKSVVDAFRFRRRVGLDVALEALSLGWRSGNISPDRIMNYARRLRIASVIEPYLESVTAGDG